MTGVQRIHLVGIGGAGMSGIAEVLLSSGFSISGSDIVSSERTRRIESLGGKVTIGHRAEQIEGAQVVVYSSAVSPDNPEIVAAQAKGIPVIPRAEMLAELMRLKKGIAVAGAHGKTTTTSMIASVLTSGRLDPTVIIGGKVNAFGSHARGGAGAFLVAEADESDGSFLLLNPTVAVVTNLDREHLSHYGSMEALEEAFRSFLQRVPFFGLAVVCADDHRLRRLAEGIHRRVVTYGTEGSPDLKARSIVHKAGRVRFEVNGLKFSLPLPGLHNVRNALAAVAVGRELGLSPSVIRESLAAYAGVERRLQVMGERDGILWIDDYAHHPTEIRATLEAVSKGWPGRRRVVLFQPHRFSRTRDLIEEFGGAFEEAQIVGVTEIYPAGERPIPGIDGQGLFERIAAGGKKNAFFAKDPEEAASKALGMARRGDIFVTMGAGNIHLAGKILLGESF